MFGYFDLLCDNAAMLGNCDLYYVMLVVFSKTIEWGRNRTIGGFFFMRLLAGKSIRMEAEF